MRRPAKSLTARLVATVSEPGKYFDGNGLYLLVRADGGKQWVQRITVRGKRRELGLGGYPLITLQAAREKALQYSRVAYEGGDPLIEKRKAVHIPTFREAAEIVHAQHRPTWRNKKHPDQFINTLRTYAFPKLGNLKVSEIASSHVLAVLDPIWLTKAETARRVKQRIGLVMKWAIAQGWRADNPAENIGRALPKQPNGRKHHLSLPYAQISGLLTALHASRAMLSTKLALEFIILTACRSGEGREARWEEIDLTATDTGPVWIVPASRMKANRVHRVPLPARAVEILQHARALDDGSGLVFPGARQGRPLSDMTLTKLVKSLGFDVTVHGFRTSFRTWAQEQTPYPREAAELQLAHVNKDRVEAAYARSDLLEIRREMIADWATFVAG